MPLPPQQPQRWVSVLVRYVLTVAGLTAFLLLLAGPALALTMAAIVAVGLVVPFGLAARTPLPGDRGRW